MPLYCHFLTEQSLIYKSFFYEKNYTHYERGNSNQFLFELSLIFRLQYVKKTCIIIDKQKRFITCKLYRNYDVFDLFYFIISVMHDSDNKRLHE